MVDAGKPTGARFPRATRLLQHAAFERVYQRGRRQFATDMTFFYLLAPAEGGSARVGLTVGRALGGAVVRNRIKRRVRDAVRLSLKPLQERMQQRKLAAEIVINPKKSAATVDAGRLREQVATGFSVIAEAKL